MTAGGSRRYTWDMNKNQLYPTDLTDRQWDCIKDLIPPAKAGGRPRRLEMRGVINAIFYIVVPGCQWRMLPPEYPAWQSVYSYLRQFREDGTCQRIHAPFGRNCVASSLVINIRPLEPWIAKVSKRRRSLECAALMQARR